MQQDFRRRVALHIATQLPEDTTDALLVLDYARDLVLRFLVEAEPSTKVTAFSASKSSR